MITKHRVSVRDWMVLAVAVAFVAALVVGVSHQEPPCQSASPDGNSSVSICKAFYGG